MRLSGSALGLSVVLAGCGGGSPFAGFWQCIDDPTQSLEVAQFENYFIVTARGAAGEYKRNGTFEDSLLQVGANNVGQAMSLELVDGGLKCTNPPNFCHCESAFEQVAALSPVPASAVEREPQPGSSAEAVTAFSTDEQILLDRDPTLAELDNGGALYVFDHAANDDNEERVFDWIKLVFYYLPQLELVALEDGGVSEVRQGGDDVSVSFRLQTRRIDRFELMDHLYESINAQIRPEHVRPLSYQNVTVELPGTTAVQLADPDAAPGAGPWEISLPVGGADNSSKLAAANELVAAINAGEILPVASFEVEQARTASEGAAPGKMSVRKTWPIVRP